MSNRSIASHICGSSERATWDLWPEAKQADRYSWIITRCPSPDWRWPFSPIFYRYAFEFGSLTTTLRSDFIYSVAFEVHGFHLALPVCSWILWTGANFNATLSKTSHAGAKILVEFSPNVHRMSLRSFLHFSNLLSLPADHCYRLLNILPQPRWWYPSVCEDWPHEITTYCGSSTYAT